MDEAPETPGLDDIQRLLDDRGPKQSPACIREIVWSSRFRVHLRLAEEQEREHDRHRGHGRLERDDPGRAEQSDAVEHDDVGERRREDRVVVLEPHHQGA